MCLSRVLTGGHFTDEEIKQSEDKFAESLHLAQMGMFNLLENDVSWTETIEQFVPRFKLFIQICLSIKYEMRHNSE